VFRVPIDVAGASRAQWLAELSQALAEAQDVLWRMAQANLRFVDAPDLSMRIDRARSLVRSIQLARIEERPVDFCPDWMRHPWDRPIDDVGA
jgi:hypothetical protein